MSEIRAANEADIPALIPLVRAMYIYEGDEDKIEVTESRLKDAFADLKIFVVEMEGLLVAYALGFPAFTSRTGHWGLHIRDLFVKEEYRGRGIGADLLNFLKEQVHFVEGNVYDWNDLAKRFYTREGVTVRSDIEYWRCSS